MNPPTETKREIFLCNRVRPFFGKSFGMLPPYVGDVGGRGFENFVVGGRGVAENFLCVDFSKVDLNESYN